MRRALLLLLSVGAGALQCRVRGKPCGNLADEDCTVALSNGTAACFCFEPRLRRDCRVYDNDCVWFYRDLKDKHTATSPEQACVGVIEERRCYNHSSLDPDLHHPCGLDAANTDCYTGKVMPYILCACNTTENPSRYCRETDAHCTWQYFDGGTSIDAYPEQQCEVLEPAIACYQYDEETQSFGASLTECRGRSRSCRVKNAHRSPCICSKIKQGPNLDPHDFTIDGSNYEPCKVGDHRGCTWNVNDKDFNVQVTTKQPCFPINSRRGCYSAPGQFCEKESYSKCWNLDATGSAKKRCFCKKTTPTGRRPSQKRTKTCGEGNKYCAWFIGEHLHSTVPLQHCQWTEQPSWDRVCYDKSGAPCGARVRAIRQCETRSFPRPRPCSCRLTEERECRAQDTGCFWFFQVRDGSYRLEKTDQPCNLDPLPERQCSFRYLGRGWTCSDLDGAMPCATDDGTGEPCTCRVIDEETGEGRWILGQGRRSEPEQPCWKFAHSRFNFDEVAKWMAKKEVSFTEDVEAVFFSDFCKPDEERTCYKRTADGELVPCAPTGDYNCEDVHGKPCLCKVSGKDKCPHNDGLQSCHIVGLGHQDFGAVAIADCFFYTGGGLQTDQTCRARSAARLPLSSLTLLLPLILCFSAAHSWKYLVTIPVLGLFFEYS